MWYLIENKESVNGLNIVQFVGNGDKIVFVGNEAECEGVFSNFTSDYPYESHTKKSLSLDEALHVLSFIHNEPKEAFSMIEFEDGSGLRFNYRLYGQAMYKDLSKVSVLDSSDSKYNIV